jgi:hypothetical protein
VSRPWKHITQSTGPSQPQRFAAIADHLARDKAQGTLTLKGPDLAYYCAFARPGDPVRDWVLTALDARIAAADAARLNGATSAAPHACPECHGRGCDYCHNLGMVCPQCRGARWLTDGVPTHAQPKITACPSCTVDRPGGRGYSAALEARAIQRHIDRRGTA